MIHIHSIPVMPMDLFLYKQQQPAATVTKAANQAVIHIHSIPATPTDLFLYKQQQPQ